MANQNKNATDIGAPKRGLVPGTYFTPGSSKIFTMMRVRHVPDAEYMEPNWDFGMIGVERGVRFISLTRPEFGT